MVSTKTHKKGYLLTLAELTRELLTWLLRDSCDRVEFPESIPRRSASVGNIELLCILNVG